MFVARVKAVLRRADLRTPLEGKVFNYGDLQVNFGRGKVILGQRLLNLTPTEYRLLCQLIKRKGKIVRSRTLLGLVGGREHMEETNYLKDHIKHLRSKLGEDPAAPKYIFTARDVGYGFAMTGELASS